MLFAILLFPSHDQGGVGMTQDISLERIKDLANWISSKDGVPDFVDALCLADVDMDEIEEWQKAFNEISEILTQADLWKQKADMADRLAEAAMLFKSFCPEHLAGGNYEHVQKGLCPTMYVTNSYTGDCALADNIAHAKQALEQYQQLKGDE